MDTETCSVEGCEGVEVSRGMCGLHFVEDYNRLEGELIEAKARNIQVVAETHDLGSELDEVKADLQVARFNSEIHPDWHKKFIELEAELAEAKERINHCHSCGVNIDQTTQERLDESKREVREADARSRLTSKLAQEKRDGLLEQLAEANGLIAERGDCLEENNKEIKELRKIISDEGIKRVIQGITKPAKAPTIEVVNGIIKIDLGVTR